MVSVVQLVEHQVVILEVAGSSPVTHPSLYRAASVTPGFAMPAAPPTLPAMGAKLAIGGVAVLLAGCGGSGHTPTATVTSTVPAKTETVTVTVTPPPPPGPKTTITTNGTFIVGTDIAPGIYRTGGGTDCYWARLKSLNTGDVIDNNVGDGPQVVRLAPDDAAFMTRGCGTWQKSE